MRSEIFELYAWAESVFVGFFLLQKLRHGRLVLLLQQDFVFVISMHKTFVLSVPTLGDHGCRNSSCWESGAIQAILCWARGSSEGSLTCMLHLLPSQSIQPHFFPKPLQIRVTCVTTCESDFCMRFDRFCFTWRWHLGLIRHKFQVVIPCLSNTTFAVSFRKRLALVVRNKICTY